MKKIALIFAIVFLCNTAVFAQKSKTVSEKDVPERYVRDFQNQVPDAQSPVWSKEDSDIYMVSFMNNDSKQSIRFTPRGMETRYFVDLKWCPKAIKDTVAHQYPNYKIREVNVLSIKNKPTYEARISLSKKKDKSAKFLNFEVDGKFLDAVDIQ